MPAPLVQEDVKQLSADDLLKQKTAEEIAKLRADLRELERPQYRRLSVIAPMITALVALLGLLWQQRNVKIERDIARNEALIARIEKSDTLRSLEDEKERYQIQLNALRDEISQMGRSNAASAPSTQKIALFQKSIPVQPLGDELSIARKIELHVRSSEYREASQLFADLQKSHFSGVGYSAYPDLVFAFDQVGENARAREVLNALNARVAQDRAMGRGYLAPGRPPIQFLLRDFETYTPRLKNSELRESCKQLVVTLQELR